MVVKVAVVVAVVIEVVVVVAIGGAGGKSCRGCEGSTKKWGRQKPLSPFSLFCSAAAAVLPQPWTCIRYLLLILAVVVKLFSRCCTLCLVVE